MAGSDLVRVAVTGQLYEAALGTAFPDPDTAPGVGWTQLGLFTDDGVEHDFSEDYEEIMSWQDGVVRVLVKSRALKLKFAALESSKAVVQTFYGETNVDGAGVGDPDTITIATVKARGRKAYFLRLVDGDAIWQLNLAQGQVCDLESPTFSGQDAIKWGVSIQALGVNGVMAEWKILDAAYQA